MHISHFQKLWFLALPTGKGLRPAPNGRNTSTSRMGRAVKSSTLSTGWSAPPPTTAPTATPTASPGTTSTDTTTATPRASSSACPDGKRTATTRTAQNVSFFLHKSFFPSNGIIRTMKFNNWITRVFSMFLTCSSFEADVRPAVSASVRNSSNDSLTALPLYDRML